MEQKGRAPIELFLLRYFPTLQDAADSLGVSTQAVRAWKETQPRNMLRYGLEIVSRTKCDLTELFEVVRSNIDYLKEEDI